MNATYSALDVHHKWSMSIMKKVEAYVDLNYALEHKETAKAQYSRNTVINARRFLEWHNSLSCPLKFTPEELTEIRREAGIED